MPSGLAPKKVTAEEGVTPVNAEPGTAKASSPSTTKLGGDLADFTLADVVQLIIFSRKTGALTIWQKGQEALLYFDQGQLVHAQCEGGSGEEAAFSVFDVVSGKFEFFTGLTPPERTIFIDGTHFLIEAARRADEAARVSSDDQEESEAFYRPHSEEQKSQPEPPRPKLSIVRNEGGLDFSLDGILPGDGDGADKGVADDLLSALSYSYFEPPSSGAEASSSDKLKSILGGLDEVLSFSMFNRSGNPLFRSAAEHDPAKAKAFFFSDGDGAATALILESAHDIGPLLGCGEFKCAVVHLPPNGRKVLFGHESRLIAAELKPGRPPQELVGMAMAALGKAVIR